MTAIDWATIVVAGLCVIVLLVGLCIITAKADQARRS